MFCTVKIKQGDTTHNFGVNAVSFTDAEKMAYEIGNQICQSGSPFEIDDIKRARITEFVEDDDKKKDLSIFRIDFASKEENAKGKTVSKTFAAFVEGSDIFDAMTNMKLFLKTWLVPTTITAIKATDLTQIYTADDIRNMKILAAA